MFPLHLNTGHKENTANSARIILWNCWKKKKLRHPVGRNYSVSILCSLVKQLLLLTVNVLVSLRPLGGAGHGTVSLQELQDRLWGSDQSAAGRPASAASQHGLLPRLPVFRQRLVSTNLSQKLMLLDFCTVGALRASGGVSVCFGPVLWNKVSDNLRSVRNVSAFVLSSLWSVCVCVYFGVLHFRFPCRETYKERKKWPTFCIDLSLPLSSTWPDTLNVHKGQIKL